MTTRSANSRMDELEITVSSIEKNQQLMEKTLEKILQQLDKLSQDVIASKNNSSSDERSPGAGMVRKKYGMVRKKYDSMGDSDRFLAVKGKKLEITTFDGTDPDGWIIRAERYFSLNRLLPEEKIDVSFIAFEGSALKWFQWENRRHPITRWEDLRRLILRQFRSTTSGTLCEQFLAVKQSGSIEEFIRKFVELAAPLEGIPEEVFLSQFLNGLENTIRAEVGQR